MLPRSGGQKTESQWPCFQLELVLLRIALSHCGTRAKSTGLATVGARRPLSCWNGSSRDERREMEREGTERETRKKRPKTCGGLQCHYFIQYANKRAQAGRLNGERPSSHHIVSAAAAAGAADAAAAGSLASISSSAAFSDNSGICGGRARDGLICFELGFRVKREICKVKRTILPFHNFS